MIEYEAIIKYFYQGGIMENISLRTKVLSALSLLLATILWGLNYIAQQEGSKFMGPFTFNTTRMFIGAAVVLPILLMRNYIETKDLSFYRPRDNRKKTLQGGIICAFVLVGGISSQQAGIGLTTVGKAGFLSSLSVIIVPLIGVLRGKRVELYQWVGIIMALIGVGLISLNQVTGINTGDLFMLLSACFIALHILFAGHFNKVVDSFQFSFLRFFFAGFICLSLALLFEDIDLGLMKNALPAILFSGIIGSGIAFTLMALSQRHLSNITTSIIMSLESVFAALSGWLILDQVLTPRELLGCLVVFAAVLGMQIYGEVKARRGKVFKEEF